MFARIAGHEPSLLGIIAGGNAGDLVTEQRTLLAAVLPLLEAGEHAAGAERFHRRGRGGRRGIK